MSWGSCISGSLSLLVKSVFMRDRKRGSHLNVLILLNQAFLDTILLANGRLPVSHSSFLY